MLHDLKRAVELDLVCVSRYKAGATYSNNIGDVDEVGDAAVFLEPPAIHDCYPI